MSRRNFDQLPALALRVREHILRMTAGGGCFVGASLSCADILVLLYARVLDIAPDRLADPARDHLLLSKGHDVPALYATLAELGYLDPARLGAHLSTGDHLYWHPNRAIPGVEFHSGSLGHLLSVGMGIAYDLRLRRQGGRVLVILGDGELNEGSIWEGLLTASALRLGNLVLIVDRNGVQANERTERLIPLEPLATKFEAFGCSVRTIDGHDFGALEGACGALPFVADAPSVIIANTVRGKGVPSLEDRVDRWFCRFSPAEIEALIAELHGATAATLEAETLVVR